MFLRQSSTHQTFNLNRCGGLREKTSKQNDSTDQSYHERKALELQKNYFAFNEK